MLAHDKSPRMNVCWLLLTDRARRHPRQKQSMSECGSSGGGSQRACVCVRAGDSLQKAASGVELATASGKIYNHDGHKLAFLQPRVKIF